MKQTDLNIKVVDKSINAEAFINVTDNDADIFDIIYRVASGELQLRKFTNKSGKTSYAVEPA